MEIACPVRSNQNSKFFFAKRQIFFLEIHECFLFLLQSVKKTLHFWERRGFRESGLRLPGKKRNVVCSPIQRRPSPQSVGNYCKKKTFYPSSPQFPPKNGGGGKGGTKLDFPQQSRPLLGTPLPPTPHPKKIKKTTRKSRIPSY